MMAGQEKMLNEEKKVVAKAKPAEPESLEVALQQLGLQENVINTLINDLGVESVDDLAMLSEEDLVGAGMKLVQAKKLLKSLSAEPEKAEDMKSGTSRDNLRMVTPMMGMGQSMIPTVPTDESWLASFKTGGVLKVNSTTYVAAIRAAISDNTHISDVPKKLVEMMEKYAEENEEPVTDEFYTLSNQLTRTSYAEIFAAIPGANGHLVTDARKNKLLKAMKDKVWPVLGTCFVQLKQWVEMWTNMSSNPTNLMMLMQGMPLAPGVGTAPDTGALRDAGDELCNAINRALSGVGTSVASAMGYDYMKIRKTVEDPSLPAKVGLSNREQLFKALGVTVDSNLVRTETNLIRFVLGFVEAKNQGAEAEAGYFSELYALGMQINWRALGINVETYSAPTPAKGLKNLSGDTL